MSMPNAQPAAVASDEKPAETKRSGRGAILVGAGILFSRLFGLVRERVFAHYFGNSIEAAAFKAALRIPNFLQNLFGEGVLSASFIPVYVGLEARGDREGADRLAGAIFGLLSLATSALVALGVGATPWFIDTVAPGFHGESRELAIALVRILFPGTGLLVMSAWCLGILNSHRRFFLSYAAPVLWNVAIIGSMVLFGGRGARELVAYVAWGAVVGSFVQAAVQVPTVLRVLGAFRPNLDTRFAPVRQVLRSFVPVVIGRGVVQVSAYVDTAYASLISERALSALAYAQTLYLIPVSLFGMAVSAAELPEMASATGTDDEVAAKLRGRLSAGSRRIAFFIVPSAAAFLLLGDVIGGALLQTGRFGAADTRYLWYLLAGSTVGLLAATQGRLYASAFYALKDPRTPLNFAVLRVVLTAGLAWWSAVKLPTTLGLVAQERHLAAIGITATTGLAAWFEYLLLKRSLERRIGPSGFSLAHLGKLWCAAGLAAVAGLGVKALLVHVAGEAPGTSMEWGGTFAPMPGLPPVIVASVVLPVVGAVYGGLSLAFGVDEARGIARRILKRGR